MQEGNAVGGGSALLLCNRLPNVLEYYSVAVALSVCGQCWWCALSDCMPGMAVACGRCSWTGLSANGMRLLEYGILFIHGCGAFQSSGGCDRTAASLP